MNSTQHSAARASTIVAMATVPALAMLLPTLVSANAASVPLVVVLALPTLIVQFMRRLVDKEYGGRGVE